MILFASTNRELETLLVMHDQFEEFPIIVILEDHNTKTVAINHMLKPRHITFADSDITNLEKVITKMEVHANKTFSYH